MLSSTLRPLHHFRRVTSVTCAQDAKCPSFQRQFLDHFKWTVHCIFTTLTAVVQLKYYRLVQNMHFGTLLVSFFVSQMKTYLFESVFDPLLVRSEIAKYVFMSKQAKHRLQKPKFSSGSQEQLCFFGRHNLKTAMRSLVGNILSFNTPQKDRMSLKPTMKHHELLTTATKQKKLYKCTFGVVFTFGGSRR